MIKRLDRSKSVNLYDVLYGFIPVTEWELKLINTPFFQRLRWIKQLGFSNYIFPGAEHNRFAHALGVMHIMDRMLHALGLAVSDEELFNRNAMSEQAMLHKSLRIAALLHDIGTHPFSHAMDDAYIKHGQELGRKNGSKGPAHSHETLGSHVILHTSYDGGITQILDDYDFDAEWISEIIAGESDTLIANQLMHSDLDADRMDFLIRDAHFSGVKYGHFDRDYLINNLATFDVGKDGGRCPYGFGVRESAIHAVEDFLIARFSWYSQIAKQPGSAKFDVLSSHIAKQLIERDLLPSFDDLLKLIENRDERFYWWNDAYCMNRIQELRFENKLGDHRLKEQCEMLIYRKPPKQIRHPLFTHRYLDSHDHEHSKTGLIQQINQKVEEMEDALRQHGDGSEWLLKDIPVRDVVFTRDIGHIARKRKHDNLVFERDPVKIIDSDGTPSLLVERHNTLMKHLSGFINFCPSVYGNHSALKLLSTRGLI